MVNNVGIGSSFSCKDNNSFRYQQKECRKFFVCGTSFIIIIMYVRLVGQLCLDELAVEAGDVGDGFAFWAYGFASTSIGAVAKAEFVHFGYHCLGTTGCLYATLWKEGELRHLRGDEEHGRAVLAGCHAGTASDAGGAVHGFVGIFLRDEDGVGILWSTCADGGVATCLDDFVEGRAIDHAVLDDRETSRTPRLDGDDVALVEFAHVELASGGSTLGLAVRCTVDVERAHAADALAAVVVEHERLLAFVDKLLVQDVKHLEERGVIGDVVHFVGVEMSLVLGAILAPELNGK